MGRIAIDGVQQLVSIGTGIRVYLLSLLSEFAALAPEHDFIVYVQSEMEQRLSLPQAKSIKYVPVEGISNPSMRVLWQAIGLGKRLRQDRADILFSPSIYVPLGCPVPSLVTIHDLAMYVYPETHTMSQRLWYQMRLVPSVRRAERILAISDAVAREITHYLSVPEPRVVTVHNGCGSGDHPSTWEAEGIQSEASIRPPLHLPDHYILVSGGNYARKNVSSLISAMEFIWRVSPELHLVIVGPTHFHNRSWTQSLSLCSRPDKVRVLGFVSDATMPYLFENARLFAFPSKYEGFGLPLLEAMASGVPVACSDIPVFREVAGEAATYFNPSSPEEIAAVCLELFLDSDRRELFVAKGKARSRQFSWRSTAVKTLREMELVMGSASGRLSGENG